MFSSILAVATVVARLLLPLVKCSCTVKVGLDIVTAITNNISIKV